MDRAVRSQKNKFCKLHMKLKKVQMRSELAYGNQEQDQNLLKGLEKKHLNGFKSKV